MELSDIFEISSALLDELSSVELRFHQDIVSKYIKEKIASKGNIMQEDFKTGHDWINVDKSLTFTKELKGKLVVLDFFTYCCINCMHILPQLKALENDFSVEDGLVVIGVHSPKFANEHSTDNVRAAVKRYEITHPVVNDHEEHLWNALGICCWPTVVIIGPDGKLLLLLMGESHEKLLHLFVKEALSVLKSKDEISPHQIPEIGIHNRFREPRLIYFPGKVSAIKTSSGHLIALADTGHHRILVVDDKGDVQHVIGGSDSGFKDGGFDVARFHAPQGIVFTDPSILYIADTENHAIRKINLELAVVETVAGDGTQGDDKVGGEVGQKQCLSSPWDIIALSPTVLLIAMAGTHQIWAYFMQDTVFWKNKKYCAGVCAAVAGSGREENRNNVYPQSAGFAQPSGLTITADTQTVYVADSESSTVRAVSTVDGKVSAVVGGVPDPQNLFAFGDKDGIGLEVRLQHPLDVAWSENKQALYICDSYNHKIKVVDANTRHCSTVTHDSLNLNEPGGLCVVDKTMYVANTNNHCITVVNLEDYSAHVMPLRLKKAESKERQMTQPVLEEQIIVNSDGGVLELVVTVQVSSNIKPLPDSPAVWTLALPDGWKASKCEDCPEISRKWTLIVPANKTDTHCQLRPHCRLFYCYNDLCSVRVLPFLVTVSYSSNAPAIVSCPLVYLFNL